MRIIASLPVITIIIVACSGKTGNDTNADTKPLADVFDSLDVPFDIFPDGRGMDQTVDLGPDLSPEVSPDSGPDEVTSAVAACLESAASIETAFAIDPDGGTGQIHAAAAFDGEGIWLAYNMPDADAGFDVWAVRIGCDGQPLAGPFQVNKAVQYNEIDPDLAVNGDRVCVVWQSDNGQQPYNLSVHYRIFSTSGEAIMAEDQPLPVIAGGQPQPGNAWMAVVSDNADGFAVSSAAGLDGATGFQVTYQKLSLDGKTNGDTVPVSWEPPVSQVYPTIAAHGDDIFFAWTRSAVDEDDEVQHTSWRKKTAGFDPAPGVPALDSSVSGNAAYGGNPHGIFLAVTSQDSNPGSRIHVKPGDTFDPAVSGAMFGKAGQLNHTPAIAPHDGGGTVAWYEVIGGIKNKLHVQQFTYDGYGFTDSSDPITANDNPAAPYQPALTAIAKGVSFVAWSEGTSPNFTIMGRFVGLSPPNP